MGKATSIFFRYLLVLSTIYEWVHASPNAESPKAGFTMEPSANDSVPQISSLFNNLKIALFTIREIICILFHLA